MQQISAQTGRPVVMAARGLVTAPHSLAAEAGIWALQQGGNAVDAAIAANAVLSVVYPHLAGLGGDVFFMVWRPGNEQPICLNGSGAAGYQATIAYYRDRGHDAVPERGPLAANTVPGVVAAWGDVQQRWGTLAWEQVFEPAIHYADTGFPVTANLAAWLERDWQILARNDEARRIFLPEDRPYRKGEILRQTDLAQTLRAIGADGPGVFYTGEVADEIVSYLEKHGGLLMEEDLRDHHSDWVDPLHTSYRGRRLYEIPPSSQGLAALLLLNVLEGLDVRALGDSTAQYYHIMAEAGKAVLANIDEWIADPNYRALPLEQLLSPANTDPWRVLMQEGRARPLCDYATGLLVPREACPEAPASTGGTVSIGAIDEGGLAVSLTQSLHSEFGSGVVAGDTGVLLQNSGSTFRLDPDDPNHLEPHKRPFETLIPAMLFDGERPWMIFGGTGGIAQPQIHAALVTRVVDLGQNIQQAIEAPRGLYGRIGGTEAEALYVEGRLPDSVLRQLREMGHDVRVVGDWSDAMGQAQGIIVDWEQGVFHGGADPRGDGQAIGW